MSAIELEIVTPRHGQRLVFPEPSEVAFEGRVVPGRSTDTAGLHYRWYSTLHAPPPSDERDPAQYPLNVGPGTAQGGDRPATRAAEGVSAFARVLRVGTHVLTFTARDRPGDSPEQLRDVTRAGMAGGADTDAPCVITVLEAQIATEPEVEAAGPDRTAVLVARAPARWSRRAGGGPGYEPDPEYHARNTVGYRWRLVSEGEDEAVATWAPRPDDADLAFDTLDLGEPRETPVLRFSASLPDDLPAGRYRVVLRVEDTVAADTWFAEDERTIEIGGAGP